MSGECSSVPGHLADARLRRARGHRRGQPRGIRGGRRRWLRACANGSLAGARSRNIYVEAVRVHRAQPRLDRIAGCPDGARHPLHDTAIDVGLQENGDPVVGLEHGLQEVHGS
jgi:hypothetical protein